MKRVLTTVALGAFALAATSASAQDMTLEGARALLTEVPGATDCTEPNAPTGGIPSGSTASKDEMMAVIGEIKAYDAASTDFGACLDAAAANMGDGLTDQHNMAVTMVVNANVEKVIALQEALNVEIRAYNEANPE